jgi:hypothetical protein
VEGTPLDRDHSTAPAPNEEESRCQRQRQTVLATAAGATLHWHCAAGLCQPTRVRRPHPAKFNHIGGFSESSTRCILGACAHTFPYNTSTDSARSLELLSFLGTEAKSKRKKKKKGSVMRCRSGATAIACSAPQARATDSGKPARAGNWKPVRWPVHRDSGSGSTHWHKERQAHKARRRFSFRVAALRPSPWGLL